jgi:hypothetical protein
MDIFAHALWTNAVFYKKYAQERTQRFLAVFFGIVPDLISFTPATLYALFSHSHFGPESFNMSIWVYRYAQQSYNVTHSLVVFAAVMLIVALVRKGKIYWPLWGWALHILIDIPSHKGFYETPFLYPLSHYKFEHGISWGHPTYMLINYSSLAVVYLVWFFVIRKNKSPIQNEK